MSPRPLALLIALVLAAPLAAQEAPGATLLNGKNTLNLKDADVRTFISTVSEITGKNFIVDPRVEGKVNIISTQPMDKDEVYRVFESVLRVNGFAAVPSGNKIGTVGDPVAPTKDDAYEYLVDLGVLLDEGNVPIDDRFVIVPAWFHGLLLKDDRFVRSGTFRGDARLANGEVGEAAGFRILKSNNVPNTSGAKFKIIAGHRLATSFAEQVLDVQTYKPEKRFGDAVKGLHVYGAKVVRPAALAMLIADRS